jgi:hypothetical protein
MGIPISKRSNDSKTQESHFSNSIRLVMALQAFNTFKEWA